MNYYVSYTNYALPGYLRIFITYSLRYLFAGLPDYLKAAYHSIINLVVLDKFIERQVGDKFFRMFYIEKNVLEINGVVSHR